MTTQDGGPAFPFAHSSVDGSVTTCDGMSLRDYAAIHAPASEIDGMIPQDRKECAAALGLSDYKEYVVAIHYPMLLSRARYAWADAMLRAREE